MRMQMSETVELDAVEIVAAETVVTRHLKIVDDAGNVRIDATATCDYRGDCDDGPAISLFDRKGRVSIALILVDGSEGNDDLVHLWISGRGDQSISLCVGGMRGPSLDMQASPARRTKKGGVRLELLAEHDSAFVTVHEGMKRTIMQLTPGEDVETFVEGAVDEDEEIAR